MDFSELPLRDIHLPEAVGWWPPAPGWWALGALMLLAAAACVYRYYRGRYRRAALRALASVRAALEQGADPAACVQRLSTLLRRYAMTTAAAGAESLGAVPGLVGDAWLRYLDGRWPGGGFSTDRGRKLLAAPYAPPRSIDRNMAFELVALCKEWLEAQPIMGQRRPARAGGGG